MYFILCEYLIHSYHYSQMQNYKDFFNMKIYNKNVIDRYILYYTCSIILPSYLKILIIIPYIQNSIPFTLEKFYKNLLKYIACKNIVNFVRKLDNKIDVKNKTIKLMMDNLVFDDYKNFIQTYITVYALKKLKSTKYTYYKIMKFVYYYETNTLFKDYSYDENIIIINNCFQDITSETMTNIDFVNSIISVNDCEKKIIYYLYFKLFKLSFMYYIVLNLFPMEYFPFFTFVIVFYKDLFFYIKYYSMFQCVEKK